VVRIFGSGGDSQNFPQKHAQRGAKKDGPSLRIKPAIIEAELPQFQQAWHTIAKDRILVVSSDQLIDLGRSEPRELHDELNVHRHVSEDEEKPIHEHHTVHVDQEENHTTEQRRDIRAEEPEVEDDVEREDDDVCVEASGERGFVRMRSRDTVQDSVDEAEENRQRQKNHDDG